MKIQGSYPFATTPETLWPFLFDPQVLRQVVPGCQSVTQIEDGRYEGRLLLRQGPLAGDYTGTLTLSEVQPKTGYAFQFRAQSAEGGIEGNGRLHLEDQNGLVYLHYSAQAQVSGGLSQQATPLLETAARSIVRQSLEQMGQYLQTNRLAGVSGLFSNEAPAASPSRWHLPPELKKTPFQLSARFAVAGIFIGLFAFVIWQRRRSRSAT